MVQQNEAADPHLPRHILPPSQDISMVLSIQENSLSPSGSYHPAPQDFPEEEDIVGLPSDYVSVSPPP